MISEYDDLDALELARLVKSRAVSPAELVEAAIDRIETRNGDLNAVILKMFDSARASAEQVDTSAPFAGVPFLLKDLVSKVAGFPTSNGNRHFAKLPAPGDSEHVRRWKKAGLIIVGKTNTPEFGLTPYTEPELFGPTLNPWDTRRTPGGSSGGSAAAVASRMVPLASAGDGGGSIRIPASACGLFGMKPTRGRTPLGPFIGDAWSGFVVEHALTRSVRDSAALLDAVQGPDIGAPHYLPRHSGSYLDSVDRPPGRLRIAVSAKPMLGDTIEQEVLRAFEDTAALLQELGHDVVEATPFVDREPFALAFLNVLAAELRADIEEAASMAGVAVRLKDFDASTGGMGLLGDALTAGELASAQRYLKVAARGIAAFFETHDVLMTPVLSRMPPATGALQPSAAEKKLIRAIGWAKAGWLFRKLGIAKHLAAETFAFIPWTPVFNVTGQPAMSVPLCWAEHGLPIGIHFVGRFGDEETLFRLAGQLELARPWSGRKPPICCHR
ncbi:MULTISPECIES: amidase [unclassified Sinorhizobium]|uniref:amidase n=1 Tax=unclassified Sinorhizobium TaxID=2613772 RepID=UPI0024C368A0|nr:MULTISPECIES: amidase [unclassified Sinorhizobium]MDK1374473.1 amidase [Sinorhizobium sp. 6-70]MDK1480223.1 amidase [Sinorhizobium sp. 6-117]